MKEIDIKNQKITKKQIEEFEQKIEKEKLEAEQYVLSKKLQRPKVYVVTVIAVILLYVIFCFGIAFGLTRIKIFAKYSILVYLTIYILMFICYLRIICITIVKCYQHYASEERRRKCLCKPTCSEYAIAVLKKYPIFIALNKIRIRLYYTCKGDYKVDLP